MNSIEISWRNVPEAEWENNAADFIGKILDFLEIGSWELSIVFCDDPFIRDLNKSYRDKDEATDVLSFSGILDDLEYGDGLIPAGDIILSLETLQGNSEYFSVQKNEEMKRLLIHGILHLSGMDHETNNSDEPMLERQEEILSNFTGVEIF